MDREAIKLKFRDDFRSHYGEAFQDWFERLAVVLHGKNCFLPIRVTRGDGGLDGIVLKSGCVYQVYAPPSIATDSATAAKVATDFAKAYRTLEDKLLGWTLIHNSADGKVGHLTAAALAKIRGANPSIQIEAMGIDGLWARLNELGDDPLAELFGFIEPSIRAKSQVRTLLNRATSLAHEDNMRQAVEVMQEALAIAQAERAADLEAEVLIGLCLASSRRNGLGDRAHYFEQLQPLIDQIHEPIVRAMAHRAHAAFLHEGKDVQSEEVCLQAAIDILKELPSDDKVLTQLCVVRSEYAHLLCQLKRLDEAKTQVDLAENYANRNPEREAGEVLDAALGSGMHWAAIARNADAVMERIAALEASVSTAYRASRVAGQLVNIANNLSHEKLHTTALAAAEASLRLAYKSPRETQENFLPGALYTIAMVNFHAGNKAVAMAKAKSLLDLPHSPKTVAIRQAAAQLISVISRGSGDIAGAVQAAETAVGAATDVVGHAFAKLNLAESLADHGQIERALGLAEDAHQLIGLRPDLPVNALVDVLGHIADYSAQLGNDEKLKQAVASLEALVVDDAKIDQERLRFLKRTEMYTSLRKRIIEISSVDIVAPGVSVEERIGAEVKHFIQFSGGDSVPPDEEKLTRVATLHEANAATLAPVLEWWKDSGRDPNAAALDFDYWARGGFAQILRNLRGFPHTVNIMLEVRSLDDIRQAIRLWGLYADFVLLMWKGKTESGKFLHLVDSEYFGPWGAGYIVALGDEVRPDGKGRSRAPAFGYASWLPAEVASFMVTEGRCFLEAGRLLIVPASGVGCVSPGFGTMEQLVAEAAGAIPGTRGLQREERPFGPLPYSPDVPLEALIDLVEERSAELMWMRSLMSQRASYFRVNGLTEAPQLLEREIADALRLMRSLQKEIVGQTGVAGTSEHVGFAVAPFRKGIGQLSGGDDQAFAPLLALECMGYGWKVSSTTGSTNDIARYEPSAGEAIGAWLVPPEPGMQFPFVVSNDPDKDKV